MSIRTFSACAFLAFTLLARAETPRLDRLYRSFIAPCCWSRNLAEHDSQAAKDVRTQIDAMVQAGKSDEEIKTALVSAYGKRILALPEGEAGTWLFAMPFVAAAAGAGLLWRLLAKRRPAQSPAMAGAVPAELESGWDAD